ncbi:hypothetical protein BASA81_000980 [Batrachochytrium salamandrivorans]|nr:hypothetical protein BASA81_000980 [Batrachochytrium salamandrivorans]
MRKPQPQELVVLGLNITQWTARRQFMFCFGGLFVCFLLYGIAQEQIMSTWKQHGLHLGWFLTMLQCAFYSGSTWLVSSSSGSRHKPDEKVKKSMWAFMLIGTLSMSTIGLSNTAIEYVSYPVQVAFKSSKPIPVMLAGIFILHKSYSWVEYVAVFCLCFGLYLFTAAEMSATSPSFELPQPSLGVGMLCCALVVDGIIGNVQQKTFDNVSPAEMIMKTKGVAAVEALVICLLQDQLATACRFFYHYPEHLPVVLAYCVCGVVGESFVMSLIKRFGALSAVISTSVRKAFTMVLSFFLFSRPWTPLYVWATLLVWIGVGLHIGGDYYLAKLKSNSKLEV